MSVDPKFVNSQLTFWKYFYVIRTIVQIMFGFRSEFKFVCHAAIEKTIEINSKEVPRKVLGRSYQYFVCVGRGRGAFGVGGGGISTFMLRLLDKNLDTSPFLES